MKKAMFTSSITKTIIAFGIISIASLFGFSAAFGYGGGYIGGGTNIPAVVSSVDVPLPIGPTQSGTLSQSFADGSKIVVEVPKGAVEGQTTFSAQQGSLEAGNTPANTTGAIMIGGQVFNISATDLNNQAVRNFSQPLTITITVNGLPTNTADLGVYYFNDATGAWTLIPGATFDTATGKVTFTVNHLTKFAIFKTVGTVASIPTNVVAQDTPPPANGIVPQVLGVKSYGDGTLLRAPDLKVYAIVNSTKHHVLNLVELKNYSTWKTFNVGFDVIAQYPNDAAGKVLGAKAYGNGVLLRAPDARIYAIVNGGKVYVSNLEELKAYSTWKMYYVSLAVIAQY